MKKFAALFVAMVLIAGSVAAMFIAQDAALVGGALKDLKFEAVPGNPKVIGGPPQFKVTKDTIEFLQKLQKDNKIVEVENNGALKIK